MKEFPQASDAHRKKTAFLAKVLELQNTLDDLTSRVDAIREENFRLRAENSVLSVYIENLMNASNVFAATSTSPAAVASSSPSSSGSSSSSKATLPQQLGTAIRCTARALGAAHGKEKQDRSK